MSPISTGYKTARRHLFNAAFNSMAYFGQYVPRVKEARRHIRIQKDIAYAADNLTAHKLDIYQPLQAGSLPVLLYIHGGAFTLCSKETHSAIATIFASRGYLVFNINYRLAPAHKFPAALEDACTAWQWVVKNAARFRGDVNRIVIAGESAGANLALAVGLAACTPRNEYFAKPLFHLHAKPKALVLLCGFLQTSDPARIRRAGASAYSERMATDVAKAYLGEYWQKPPEEFALADPVNEIMKLNANDLPPIFIGAGTIDPVFSDSKKMEKQLSDIHADYEAVYYPGEWHAFQLMYWRPNAIKCWRDSLIFLDRHLA